MPHKKHQNHAPSKDQSHGVIENLRSNNRRVVVLIDDLDRCQPQVAYRLLEGLKTYLTLPNCVFVLGMNQQVVEDAIAKEFPMLTDSKAIRTERASAYLEKLYQTVWLVPRIRDPKAFLLRLLPEHVRDCVDHAVNYSECLPPNPRRIKGFANAFSRMAGHCLHGDADPANSDTVMKIRMMFVATYVYQFHRELYRIWESNLDVYDQLRRWCRRGEFYLSDALTPGEKEHERPLRIPSVVERLHATVVVSTDERSPVPQYTYHNAFPDPADRNVFWIQRLFHELASDNLTTRESFAPFLRGDALAPGGEERR